MTAKTTKPAKTAAKTTKPAKTAAKTPAAKPVRPVKAPGAIQSRISETLATYAKTYIKNGAKTASGHASIDCGDQLACDLRSMNLSQVYAVAAKKLGIDEGTLLSKYSHLNAGMQRMNLGNRIRAALKSAN